MRIWFVNRYFYPDHSATSQMLTDVAFHFSSLGYAVHVVVSDQRYEDPRAGLPAREEVRGVSVFRVRGPEFGRSGLSGRLFDDFGFLARARGLLARLLEPGDVLVSKTDPPLLGMALADVARRRRAHRVNWLQDLFPEVALGLGVLGHGAVYRLLLAWRNRSLASARLNIAISEAMKCRLLDAGASPYRVRVIPNWADAEAVRPVARADNPLRAAWGFAASDFVLGYSGNLGRAHEIETLLGAAEMLRAELGRGESGLRLCFIGGGKGLSRLQSEVMARGLPGFSFMPYQDRGELSRSLSVADAHLVILRPEMEGLILPSKLYGIAAVARPVVYVGDVEGEVGTLVRERSCGVAVPSGDGEALAAAVRQLMRAPDVAVAMGERARAMLVSDFSFQRAMRLWVDALELLPPTRDGAGPTQIPRS